MDDPKDVIIRNLEWQTQMMKKTEDEAWYNRFDVYFNDSKLNTLIKYDPRVKQWYKYEKGVYHPIEVDAIRTIVYDWDALVNEKLSNAKVAFLLLRIRAQCLFIDTWDPDHDIDNCLNGLVNKNNRELTDHTPEYPSLEQLQRTYDSEQSGIIPPLFEILVRIIPLKKERDWFIQFLINIVHKNFDDELFCILYGPKGGGKSTILQLFELLFGKQNVGKTPLQKIGKRFGLKEIYNKRVNVNPDLPIMPMNDYTIALMKELTGNDGGIEVELKGRNSFQYDVQCFLIFGINQLMGFKATSEKEIESVFRRALLINLPKTLKRDTKFKRKLSNSDFLDELYSWLVYMRPLNIIDDGDIDWWIDIQREKWLTNANPILTICHEIFEYCEEMTLPVRHVIDTVRQNVEDDGLLSSQQLQTNVSQALQTMKIYRDNGRGINAKYLNIQEKT